MSEILLRNNNSCSCRKIAELCIKNIFFSPLHKLIYIDNDFIL